MKIYKDIKRIANKLSQVHRLVEKLENTEDFDLYGVEWNSARLVSGLQERKDGLYSEGGRIAEYAGDYYCAQSQGYIEDNYYGHLYFKTDVPGQFVEVWFEC